MKAFLTIKTGYAYSKYYGWRGDYYKIVIINGSKTYSYNIITGYEKTEPIKQYLKDKGYTELYAGTDICGQIKRNDIKGYRFDTLEDIKRNIK